MPKFIDQCGRQVSLPDSPQRIVSLVPSITELLCDLGLEDQIVGVTKFCVHPAHIKSAKTIVGGTKNVNFEKIRKLNPDIIIANKEENTAEIVGTLEKDFTVWVTDVASIDDNIKMISDFGEIFSRTGEADKWVERINFELKSFDNFITAHPIRRVVYLIWKNPYMAAGGGTFIGEMLRCCRFSNICELHDRYPEIDPEKIIEAGSPTLVFLSSEPYPFSEKDMIEINLLAPHLNVLLVDGEMFSWYGTRPVRAFKYLRNLVAKMP